jgi:hypothetical protein
MYAQCPACLTQYHHSRLIPSNEMTPQLGREYTILCSVCPTTFHVEFVPQPRRFFGLLKGGIHVVTRD